MPAFNTGLRRRNFLSTPTSNIHVGLSTLYPYRKKKSDRIYGGIALLARLAEVKTRVFVRFTTHRFGHFLFTYVHKI